MKYLLDSNIIIYYLNGDKHIENFITKNKNTSSISLITYYEVLNYNFTKDEEIIVRNFLDSFEVINISKNIVNKSLENRKLKKIKIADNFILATAQTLNLKLITRNLKDFEFFIDNLLNPFSK